MVDLKVVYSGKGCVFSCGPLALHHTRDSDGVGMCKHTQMSSWLKPSSGIVFPNTLAN